MSDVVIVGAKRTAIGSMLGQFTGIPTPTLGATAIGAALEAMHVLSEDVPELSIAVVASRVLFQTP